MATAANPELLRDLPDRATVAQEPIILHDALILLGVPRGMAEGALCCLFHNGVACESQSAGTDFCPFRLKAVVFHSALNHAALVFERGTPLATLCERFNKHTSRYQVIAAVPYHTMYRYRDPFPRRPPRKFTLINEWTESKERFQCINIPFSPGDTSNESMES
jgi:hypothetical protein